MESQTRSARLNSLVRYDTTFLPSPPLIPHIIVGLSPWVVVIGDTSGDVRVCIWTLSTLIQFPFDPNSSPFISIYYFILIFRVFATFSALFHSWQTICGCKIPKPMWNTHKYMVEHNLHTAFGLIPCLIFYTPNIPLSANLFLFFSLFWLFISICRPPMSLKLCTQPLEVYIKHSHKWLPQ